MLTMKHTRPELPETGFVRLPQILSLIPISRSAWWAGIREGKFPKGIKLGSKTTVWRAEAIRALINQLR
jgi:predicted DNA-binding transcriptional regulator AlpA